MHPETPSSDARAHGAAPAHGSRLARLTAAALLLGATIGVGLGLRPDPTAAAASPRTGGLPLAFHAAGAGPVHFSGNLDRGAVHAGGDGQVRMELELRADAKPGVRVRRPTDLVVVLDRSGSMSGEKLEHARAAVRALLEQLDAGDRFSLVTYSDAAEVRIPFAAASTAARAGWIAALDAVPADGGTNMSAGLDLGLVTIEGARAAGRMPRLILVSDGLANQGDSSPEGLRARATRAVSGEYALSTVGVGSDFDEQLLAALADAGTGNFHYVQSSASLHEILARELDTARETVATAVTIRIAPPAGVQVIDVAGYPLERTNDGAVLVRPGTLFAGQTRKLFATLAVTTQGAPVQELGAWSVSYRGAGGPVELAFAETPRVARVATEDDFFASVDRDRWASGVVVDEYNRVQQLVAKDVKEGRADGAVAKLEEYRERLGVLNARIGSSDLARQLEEVKRLEGSVAAAAAAPAPERALAAKEMQSIAHDAARPGSKKK